MRQPFPPEHDFDAFVDRMARSEFAGSAIIHRGQHGSHPAARITERTGVGDRLRGKVIYLVLQPHSVHWIVEIGWDTEELGPVIDEILGTFNPDGRAARIMTPVP